MNDDPLKTTIRLLAYLRESGFHNVNRSLMVLHLFRAGPCRPCALADACGVNPVIVRSFVDQGGELFVEEDHPTDRRGRVIDLAPAFRKKLGKIMAR